MATVSNESSFTKYTLTQGEDLAGACLSTFQRMRLQNSLCTIAEAKMALIPDPNNYAAFIQQEAFYSGQIALINLIFQDSDFAVHEMNNPSTDPDSPN